MAHEDGASHRGDMSEHTLHTQQLKRLERSASDRVVAGVCAGLGRYFDLTPAVFRLGLVVLTLLGGAGILVYIAAVVIIPKEGEERSMAEDILVNRRDHPGRLVALGLLSVALLSLLTHADTLPTEGAAWALLAAAGVIFLWTRKGRGLAAAVLALVALLAVAIAATIVAAFAWFDVSLRDGVGQQTYVPVSVRSIGNGYDLGVGELRVDLTRLPAGSNANVNARVGIGQLKLIVPSGAKVAVMADVKAGSVDAFGRHEDGTDVHVATADGGAINVRANVGAGHIEVVKAP